ASEGVNVAICSRTASELNATARDIASRGVKAAAIIADIFNLADIDRAGDETAKNLGPIAILVSTAGGTVVKGNSIETMDDEAWMKALEVNAMRAARCTARALPGMRERKWGRVVTVASLTGREASRLPAYAMAKAAEIVLMKSLSQLTEYAANGITFNS